MLLGAFKWSWAVPERSGDVPGGSRARIIDFSMVLGGLGGGAPRARHPGAGIVRPPKSRFFKTDQTPHTTHQAQAQGQGQACLGKHVWPPTHPVAQSAVADIDYNMIGGPVGKLISTVRKVLDDSFDEKIRRTRRRFGLQEGGTLEEAIANDRAKASLTAPPTTPAKALLRTKASPTTYTMPAPEPVMMAEPKHVMMPAPELVMMGAPVPEPEPVVMPLPRFMMATQCSPHQSPL